jgi:tRNA threonylcarbamoyladenosine dehydratase
LKNAAVSRLSASGTLGSYSKFMWFQSLHLHSHRTQLVITALTASVTTAALLSLYTSYSKRDRRKQLDRDVKQSLASHPPQPASSDSKPFNSNNIIIDPRLDETTHGYDEDLIREQLARNYAFFGEGGMAKIRGGSVVIVGCGGVGSWAAVMLVRS